MDELTDEMIRAEAAARAPITSLEYVERSVFEAGAKWARVRMAQPDTTERCPSCGSQLRIVTCFDSFHFGPSGPLVGTEPMCKHGYASAHTCKNRDHYDCGGCPGPRKQEELG